MIDDYRKVYIKSSSANDVLSPVRISANDHDGREILFELWDGDAAVVGNELSAKLIYTTADGTGSYITLSKTTSNGTVAFTGPFPEEMFGVEYGAFAVQITDGTDIVSTLRVPYKVDAQLIDEDSPVAQDALSEFRSAVQSLDNLLPATTTRLGTIKVGNGLSAANDGTLSVDLSTSNLPTVPISKGGTGGTTAKEGQYNLLSNMAEITADASDDTYILGTHATVGTSNGFAAKRKLSNIWSYIVGKIRAAFGFSSSNVLAISNGGTGATTKASAITSLGVLSTDGGSVSGTLKLTKTTDASGTSDNQPALMLGASTGTHLEFDGNEIMAKLSGTTTGTLHLNADGGDVDIAGGKILFAEAGNVVLNSGTIDRDGTSPTATQMGPGVLYRDKDGERIAMVRVEREDSGCVRTSIGAFSETEGGTEVPNWLILKAYQDGTRVVTLTDVPAWKTGLGLCKLLFNYTTGGTWEPGTTKTINGWSDYSLFRVYTQSGATPLIGTVTGNGILRCVGCYNNGSVLTLYCCNFTISGNAWTCTACGYQAMGSSAYTSQNIGQILGIV